MIGKIDIATSKLPIKRLPKKALTPSAVLLTIFLVTITEDFKEHNNKIITGDVKIVMMTKLYDKKILTKEKMEKKLGNQR